MHYLFFESLIVLASWELTGIDGPHAFVGAAVAISLERAAGLLRHQTTTEPPIQRTCYRNL